MDARSLCFFFLSLDYPRYYFTLGCVNKGFSVNGSPRSQKPIDSRLHPQRWKLFSSVRRSCSIMSPALEEASVALLYLLL